MFFFKGSLSAWFRSKYPYMVDGAVATSAPIYAQVDFKGKFKASHDSLSNINTCANVNDVAKCSHK